MEQNIRGIDVIFMYADGTTAKGHISPNGVHAHTDVRALVTEPLKLMREAIEPALKPYNTVKR